MTLLDTAAQEFIVPRPLRSVDVTMSDGAIIRLRQHGRPGRTRLVLSHGNGLAIDAYLPFWQGLAQEFELILFDMRNHGENPPHDPAAHQWDRFAQDIGEIFAGIEAHFDKARTVGAFHSLSAVSAILHELSAGPKWDALALFDPPLYPPDGHPLQALEHADMEDLSRRARRRPERYASPEQFAAQLMRQPIFRRLVPGAHLLFARTTLRPDGAGHWALRNPRELEAHIYEGNVDPTVWPRLPSLRRPTILIAADPDCPDTSPPASCCRAIHQELGLAYVKIPDTTHFLQIEKPEACRAALKDFIARQRLD